MSDIILKTESENSIQRFPVHERDQTVQLYSKLSKKTYISQHIFFYDRSILFDDETLFRLQPDIPLCERL